MIPLNPRLLFWGGEDHCESCTHEQNQVKFIAWILNPNACYIYILYSELVFAVLNSFSTISKGIGIRKQMRWLPYFAIKKKDLNIKNTVSIDKYSALIWI